VGCVGYFTCDGFQEGKTNARKDLNESFGYIAGNYKDIRLVAHVLLLFRMLMRDAIVVWSTADASQSVLSNPE